jgi:hypothetical protein
MAKNRILIALIPVKAAVGVVMLLLSVKASPPMFGLYLSIAAWLLVISLVVLPFLIVKRWLTSHERESLTPLGAEARS